jgi:AcrR family transcriptional regulator
MRSNRGVRPAAKSEVTRTRILGVARLLFNEHGTAAVSTNRIAAELGMSPGNLYYHFADKKEIVRGLLGELIEAYGQPWLPDSDGREDPPTPRHALMKLRESLARGSDLAWQYRFFNREMVALMRADPELAATYREVYRRRMAEWSTFAEGLVEHGLLRSPRSLSDLTVAIWLIAENWITFLDITGDPDDPAQVARQADLVMVVLEPHLTPKARRLWKAENHDD